MSAPTLDEMQVTARRLQRDHHVPADATLRIDGDHLIVTVKFIEDADRLHAELRLHALATYTDRWTGWYAESQLTVVLDVPRGVIPAQGRRGDAT